jgi:hypothetical protein
MKCPYSPTKANMRSIGAEARYIMSEMPTKLRSWSFADDRRMMHLADLLRSLEAIADLMKRTRENAAKRAKRLGVSLKFGRAMKTKMK